MAIRSTVILDRGWNRIKHDCVELRNQGVKVGFRAGGPSKDGVPVVDYATFNEFGTSDGNIPSRPFMRRTADEAEKPIRAFAATVVRQLVNNRLNVNGVMSALGQWYRARIQHTIRNSKSWAIPNAPSTIKAKKSSTPLIDDAVMIGSVDFERTRV